MVEIAIIPKNGKNNFPIHLGKDKIRFPNAFALSLSNT